MSKVSSRHLRIVDIGCGLGYLVRALSAHGRLGQDVELIGCDMNVALVEAARKLAEEESLGCELRVANAFRLEQPAHIYISSGVAHHFAARTWMAVIAPAFLCLLAVTDAAFCGFRAAAGRDARISRPTISAARSAAASPRDS